MLSKIPLVHHSKCSCEPSNNYVCEKCGDWSAYVAGMRSVLKVMGNAGLDSNSEYARGWNACLRGVCETVEDVIRDKSKGV